MAPLAKFLLIVFIVLAAAIYFHFNREQQTYSKTLFGQTHFLINDTYVKETS